MFDFSLKESWSQEGCRGNNLVGIILFLLRCTFLVPSLKNTAPIFLEIILIQYFVVLVKHHFPHSHKYTKTKISLNLKKMFQKGQRHST